LVDLYQRGPNAVRSKKIALEVIQTLEGHDWLERVPKGEEIDGVFRKDVWRVREVE
jgi:hypothetical protein